MITPLQVSVGRISTEIAVLMGKLEQAISMMLIVLRVARSALAKCQRKLSVKANVDEDATAMYQTKQGQATREEVAAGRETTTH